MFYDIREILANYPQSPQDVFKTHDILWVFCFPSGLKLKAEGSQLATNCSQLKMKSADGKEIDYGLYLSINFNVIVIDAS